VLLVSAARQVKRITNDALSGCPGDADGRDLAAFNGICFAGVSVFGVLANDHVIDFAGFPNLLQLTVDFMFDARIEFNRPDIGVEIQLLPVEYYLCESRQLWFRIGFARLGKYRFAVKFVADGAQKDRVRFFAFLKRAVRPFHFVFGVIMAAAGNLFDLEIDLKHVTGSLENVQRTR